MWQHCPVRSQGCGCSAGHETDRPVQVMIPTPRTLGNPPQQDPFQTLHRRWRPQQKAHLAALKHTVSRSLSKRFVVLTVDYKRCCLCSRVRMIVIVVVQACGRPNQRTRSRMRLCLRYRTFNAVNFVSLTEHCVVDPLSHWQND